MIAGCQYRHLVPARGVGTEKALNFFSDSLWLQMVPFDDKAFKHRERTTTLNLSKLTKLINLSISETHVLLIILSRVRVRFRIKRAELSRWLGFGDLTEHVKIGILGKPLEEHLEICFVDASDRIKVTCAAIIFSHVAKEALSNICCGEDQQEALIATAPWHKLSHEERHNHPGARLNVLQGQVLRIAAALRTEFWHLSCCFFHNFDNLGIDVINGNRKVV